MRVQQRTALASVVAAAALIALKLVTGLLTHSLGLIAEAAHSASDLVAALLTFFAVRVAVRPPDREHPFGHGKAEHLSALAEAGILVIVAIAIAVEALARLTGPVHHVDAHGYALAVIGVVIVVDASRTVISRRVARRTESPALEANALHFALDMLGSGAVLVGLVLVRAGEPRADAVAALLVAGLVLFSAGRLARRNARALMDQASAGAAQRAAREAIEGVGEHLALRRLRMRQSGGTHFADVVVAVEPDVAISRAHAVASAIEEAIARRLPGADVVVHVEPDAGLGPLRQRATAAALAIPEVREVHNVVLLRVADGTELTLHMKLPSGLTLRAAHEIASQVEAAILEAAPEIGRVRTHIEPLQSDGATPASQRAGLERERDQVRAIVRELTAREPGELRFRETEGGIVLLLTLELDPEATLEQAHSCATEAERRIRARLSGVEQVLIHTEPA
ncbi:MAG: cation-efflux pump [Solirubrobacterales bacterium]|nr:cation-efflux pump [Solirubrobacterales bacterium]